MNDRLISGPHKYERGTVNNDFRLTAQRDVTQMRFLFASISVYVPFCKQDVPLDTYKALFSLRRRLDRSTNAVSRIISFVLIESRATQFIRLR